MRREPSLGRMALLSIALHVTIVITFSLTSFFRSHRYLSPNPYTVRLVAPEAREKSRPAGKSRAPEKPAAKPVEKKPEPKKPEVKPVEKKQEPKMSALKPDRKPEPTAGEEDETANETKDQLVNEEIEKIRRIRELAEKSKDTDSGAGAAGGGVPAEIADRYHAIVRQMVHERWVYSGPVSEYLEAEVLISIGPQGGVLSQRIIKSSGNRLFDRSVMGAIAKASPFPPPPEGVDTEIQFRFRPGDMANF